MPLIPMVLLFVQGAVSAPVDVPILHRRPSKIARLLQSMGEPKVLMLPDDPSSTIRLIGTKEDVAEAKSRIALFDNAPRRAKLAVRVENPLEHALWRGEVEVANNESWTGEDGGTGVRLRIAARLNDDGTCTLFLEAKSPDARPVSLVVRAKVGMEEAFEMPINGIYPKSGKPAWTPRFAVKFLTDVAPS